MYYTVYKVTNKKNGKTYIGKHQTKELDDGYMGSGRLIKRAIQKYGLENFTKEILFIFDNEDDMNLKEREIVVVNEKTYNLCEGGKGGFGFINSHGKNLYGKNAENGRVALEALRATGFVPNPDPNNISVGLKRYYQENGSHWTGRTHKPDAIEKMKGHTRQSGEKNSQFGTVWINDGIRNRKVRKAELEKFLCSGYSKGRI